MYLFAFQFEDEHLVTLPLADLHHTLLIVRAAVGLLGIHLNAAGAGAGADLILHTIGGEDPTLGRVGGGLTLLTITAGGDPTLLIITVVIDRTLDLGPLTAGHLMIATIEGVTAHTLRMTLGKFDSTFEF